jgi:hypothetical protein
VRSTDHEFLVSARAREVVREEGIVLTDHRAVQDAWASAVAGKPLSGPEPS